MNLWSPTASHLKQMMTWFDSEKALQDWGGPFFRYPFDKESFAEDLNLDAIKSYSLVSEQGELLAFGQYYQRIGRCHLGRLVVNPAHRGKGLVAILIRKLTQLGLAELKVPDCSLFVYLDNHSAISAYQKLGFEFAEYPEEIALKHCGYMIASAPLKTY